MPYKVLRFARRVSDPRSLSNWSSEGGLSPNSASPDRRGFTKGISPPKSSGIRLKQRRASFNSP